MKSLEGLTVVYPDGESINYKDFVSDPFILGLVTCLGPEESGTTWRLTPLPEGWNVSKIIHTLSLIGDFVSGQENEQGHILQGSSTKRWRFVHVGTSVLFALGIQDLVVVWDTGDSENVLEGGYTSIFSVLLSDVEEEKGLLTYDTVSFSSVALGNYQQNLGITPAEVPRGPHVRHINNMRTIYDEECEELTDRGVCVAYVPDPTCSLAHHFYGNHLKDVL
jgi:hypothetical protein